MLRVQACFFLLVNILKGSNCLYLFTVYTDTILHYPPFLNSFVKKLAFKLHKTVYRVGCNTDKVILYVYVCSLKLAFIFQKFAANIK
jgi:hypothetical protein